MRSISSTKGPGQATTTDPFGNVQSGTNPGTTIQATKTIKLYDGSTLVVRDFTKDVSVQKDPYVPGQYDLVGGVSPDASTPYQVFYDTQDDYFGITIFKEPLGQNRLLAEQKLQAALGISQDAMCKLSYVIAPGPGVNDLYAGKNLGFSFCPGATQLP